MKEQQHEQNNSPSQLRKLRHPKINYRQSSPFQAKHNSLRKLMEMKILPPLHPQTDVKRTIQQKKQCCPQQFQQNNKQVSLLMLGKSEQLLTQTPKFSFENIVINHLQKQSQKIITISHDQDSKRKRKQSQLGITFGKAVKKLQSHRYTEMDQMKARKRKPLIDISNRPKLGKYDSIFKPIYKQVIRTQEEVIKNRILPPISFKHL